MIPLLYIGGTVIVGVVVATLVECCTGARGRGARLAAGAVVNCPNAPPQPAILVPVLPPPVIGAVLPPPVITSVARAAGTTGGATRVVIHGNDFTAGNVTVQFDGVNVAHIVQSTASRIDIDTRAHLAGDVDVRVTNSDGQSATATRAYRYRDPEVTAITPNVGPLADGQAIRVSGEFFGPNVHLTIAGRPALAIVRVDEQTITATVPALVGPTPSNRALTIDVINTHDQARGRLVAAYTYQPLSVTGVAPQWGPSSGGTALTITGTGFDAATIISIAGLPAGALALQSPTCITCTAPALPRHGTVDCDVVATTPAGAGQTDTLADGYTYLAPVTLAAVVPPLGARAGETAVAIFGMGFKEAMECRFAGKASQPIIINAGHMSARTPGGQAFVDNEALPVTVRVNNAQQASELADAYVYRAEERKMNVVIYPGGHDLRSTLALGANDGALRTQLLNMHNTGSVSAQEGISDALPTGNAYHAHIAGGAGGMLFCTQVMQKAPALPYPVGTIIPARDPVIHQVLDVTLSRPGNNYDINVLASRTPNGMWHCSVSNAAANNKHTAAMRLNFAGDRAVAAAVTGAFTLLSVEAATGALARCDDVVIHGRNIPDDPLVVTFGGVAALAYTRNSATSITATPPVGAGSVEVRVTDADGVYVALPAAFTYQPFAATALWPAIGSHDEDVHVVITGTGFTQETTVTVGGVAAEVAVYGSTVITTVVPALAGGAVAGMVNVVVLLTPGGATRTLTYQYMQ